MAMVEAPGGSTVGGRGPEQSRSRPSHNTPKARGPPRKRRENGVEVPTDGEDPNKPIPIEYYYDAIVYRCCMCTNADLYFNQPINKAIFDFTNSPLLPSGTKSLLALGLKFCLKSPKPTNKIKESLERFKQYVRTKHWLLRWMLNDDDDRYFNPKLYLRNPNWDPQDSEDAIESALDKFEERVMELHNNHHQQQLNRKKHHAPSK
eukprot:scaffold30255_cov52-Cyclotella_meneghiniana.AAC.1